MVGATEDVIKPNNPIVTSPIIMGGAAHHAWSDRMTVMAPRFRNEEPASWRPGRHPQFTQRTRYHPDLHTVGMELE